MLVLLHTNDLHGHLTGWRGWEGDLKNRELGGLDRLAAAVKQVREEHAERVLLLDAGDCWSDTMLANQTQGEALLDALNFLQYDAMTIGNHEPDFGSQILRRWIANARFPVVAANLVETPSGQLLTKPYVLRTVGDVTLGILGLAYPKTGWTTAAKNVAGLDFQEPVQAVRRYLPKMRDEGAQIIIVLSHLGLFGDKHLAQAVPEVDVIVGGHSHNRMTEALRVGNTLIVQAGGHGSDLGRLDLTVNRGKIHQHHHALITLDHRCIPADPEAARFLHQKLVPHLEKLQEPIGQTEEWLIRAQTIAGQEARKRDEESPVDSLFADILRAETEADLTLLPGVGYGVAIPPGPITAAQHRQLLPHNGNVVTMRLQGGQVREVLEQSLENVYTDDPTLKVGGMIQISGIRFRYNPALPCGHRVVELEQTEGPWNPDGLYKVATNSLLAHGGHHYRTFLAGANKTEHQMQYEMIKQWFKTHSPVTTPPLGRIVKNPSSNAR